jgi:hypothetical protein
MATNIKCPYCKKENRYDGSLMKNVGTALNPVFEVDCIDCGKPIKESGHIRKKAGTDILKPKSKQEILNTLINNNIDEDIVKILDENDEQYSQFVSFISAINTDADKKISIYNNLFHSIKEDNYRKQLIDKIIGIFKNNNA